MSEPSLAALLAVQIAQRAADYANFWAELCALHMIPYAHLVGENEGAENV